MSKLQDATVRLYHKKCDEHFEICFKILETGILVKDKGNTLDIVWFWAIKRWPKTFSHREYELRVIRDEVVTSRCVP